MPFAQRSRRLSRISWLLLGSLAGCASTPGTEWRLLGRTQVPWGDDAALVQRLSQVAGVPVGSTPQWAAPQWISFTLQCPDRGACKRATMKLAAQPGLFAELRREATAGLPSRPTPSATP